MSKGFFEQARGILPVVLNPNRFSEHDVMADNMLKVDQNGRSILVAHVLQLVHVLLSCNSLGARLRLRSVTLLVFAPELLQELKEALLDSKTTLVQHKLDIFLAKNGVLGIAWWLPRAWRRGSRLLLLLGLS